MPETRRPRAAEGRRNPAGADPGLERRPVTGERGERVHDQAHDLGREHRAGALVVHGCSALAEEARVLTIQRHPPPIISPAAALRAPAGEPGRRLRRESTCARGARVPEILERLAAAAATAPRRRARRARSLPSPEPEEVARRQALTAEAVALLDGRRSPTWVASGGSRRRRARGARCARPASSEPSCGDAVALAGRRRLDALRPSGSGAAPAGSAETVDPRPGVADAVGDCDRGGRIGRARHRVAAAPPPARRASERTAARRGGARPDRALRRRRGPAQERFVTERGGRPVLALKATARSKVPGIVHDVSGSGQTLFVEPFAVVELSNRLAEAAAPSARRPSGSCASCRGSSAIGRAPSPSSSRRVVAIDLAFARGALSRRWRGARSSSPTGPARRRAPPTARSGHRGADRPRPRRVARARRSAARTPAGRQSR